MNPLVFDHLSWHYKAARWGGMYSLGETNLCQYTGWVLWGLTSLLARVALIVIMSAAIITFLVMAGWGAHIVFTQYDWQVPFSEFVNGLPGRESQAVMSLVFLTVIVSTITAILGALGTYSVFESRQLRRYLLGDEATKSDNFILNAVRNFKRKTCVRVTFK